MEFNFENCVSSCDNYDELNFGCCIECWLA